MTIERVCDTGCCGIEELSGFYSGPNERQTWFRSLRNVLLYHSDSTFLPAIFLFSGAEYQKEGLTPFSFARWLQKQGETVVKTSKVVNKNSGHKIQAFLWVPSKKFQNKFSKFNEEQEKLEEKNGSKSKSDSVWER